MPCQGLAKKSPTPVKKHTITHQLLFNAGAEYYQDMKRYLRYLWVAFCCVVLAVLLALLVFAASQPADSEYDIQQIEQNIFRL